MKKLEKKFLKNILENEKLDEKLAILARLKKEQTYGNKIIVRGLIEFTNHCKNNCYYCNLRRDNLKLYRYRLTKNEILNCCKKGYSLGFRSFVLQGGEDLYYDDFKICEIIKSIKETFPDSIIALSIGEKTKKSYESFFKAGARRYLLRHESTNYKLYSAVHPKTMSLKNRKDCLFNLKNLGYGVGAGFIVGLPGQTLQNLVEDVAFLKNLNPKMIGIGPFIRSKNTPFKNFKDGEFKLTLRLISVLRILFKDALIPATTALCSLNKRGLELGLKAGANVIMVNISPKKAKNLYRLYPEKKTIQLDEKKAIDNIENLVSRLNFKISFLEPNTNRF